MEIKLKLYIIILVGLGIIGCTNTHLDLPPCSKRQQSLYPELLRRCFDFKKGSWWIYEDSAALKNDSIWLDKAIEEEQKELFDDQRICNCNFDKCFKSKRWYYMDMEHQKHPSGVSNGEVNNLYIYTYLQTEFYINQPNYFYIFSFSDEDLQSPANPFWCCTNDSMKDLGDSVKPYTSRFEILPTYTVNAKTYNDVIKIPSYGYTLYLAKDIGMIALYQGSIQLKGLINYHIVK